MPLPCPGPDQISLLDIQNEFGGSYFDFDNPYTQIAEYYRGGLYVEDNPTNANVPTSGQISFADFFCSSSEVVITLNGKYENLVVRDLFGGIDGVWGSSKRKRLVLTYNAIVYSNKSGSERSRHALIIDNNFGGSLIIDNYGQIIGASGDPGQNGGNAVFVSTSGSKKVTFNNLNTGRIAGGGGGGGTGGNGELLDIANYIPSGGGFSISGAVGSFGNIGGIGRGYRNSELVGPTEGGRPYTGFVNGFISNSVSLSLVMDVRVYNFSINTSGRLAASLYFRPNSSNISFNTSGSTAVEMTLGNNTIFGTLNSSGSTAVILNAGLNTQFRFNLSGSTAYRINKSTSSDISISSSGSVSSEINVYDQNYSTIQNYMYIAYDRGSGQQTFTISTTGGASGGNGGYYGSNGSPGKNGTTSNGTAGGAAGAAIIGARNLIGTNDGVVYGSIID
jgi:hypothetical protein